jgi:N-acetylglucosaminyldiphosphoundecaprenol N-acetyl-beta-D-mannosaminyltransferase
MRLNTEKVLGISITTSSKSEILEEIQKYLTQTVKKGQKPLKIFTPNTEQLVAAQKNPDFAGVLNKADVSLPDTVGVVWASRFLTKNPVQKPIPGVEFMENLVQLASKYHVPIGLIGGRDNLAVDTLACLREKYLRLQDCWAEDGPEIEIHPASPAGGNSQFTIHNSQFTIHNSNEELYFERLARRIVREGTRMVFVALGPPKQEYFIERLARQLHGVILMSVGGSFDILCGRLRRAPAGMRSLGLEWLWRLILEPRRLRRQLALVEFVWLVIREKQKIMSGERG